VKFCISRRATSAFIPENAAVSAKRRRLIYSGRISEAWPFLISVDCIHGPSSPGHDTGADVSGGEADLSAPELTAARGSQN
jgi:hypothetical protein